ncbi:hypothetical protein BMS3Bbin04_01880 [bacterium BMS3Bbin04]|nr:hypothetical protein BMS3Bbin04_01880 [bacterium BMS3Bbin04]
MGSCAEYIRDRPLLIVIKGANNRGLSLVLLVLSWDCQTTVEARLFLKIWYRKVRYSGLKPMKKFVKMLKRHEDGIFAWFEHRISNGIAEALNNTAKAISRRSRGFRTADTFSTVLMHCMGGLQLPQTVHRFL